MHVLRLYFSLKHERSGAKRLTLGMERHVNTEKESISTPNTVAADGEFKLELGLEDQVPIEPEMFYWRYTIDIDQKKISVSIQFLCYLTKTDLIPYYSLNQGCHHVSAHYHIHPTRPLSSKVSCCSALGRHVVLHSMLAVYKMLKVFGNLTIRRLSSLHLNIHLQS